MPFTALKRGTIAILTVDRLEILRKEGEDKVVIALKGPADNHVGANIHRSYKDNAPTDESECSMTIHTDEEAISLQNVEPGDKYLLQLVRQD